MPQKGKPIFLNGAIHTLFTIIKRVASLEAEADLGVMFLNAQEGLKHRLSLEEMVHYQPPTPIHFDNTTSLGIANNTVKQQLSRAMNMRYYWILDQIKQDSFNVLYAPGLENLVDYPSKHHTYAHNICVRPYYVHMPNSPCYLPRAPPPRVLLGCVYTVRGTLGTYLGRVPLPRISISTCHTQTLFPPRDNSDSIF